MNERIDNAFSELRVLLVDDDEACRGFLAFGLEHEGATVVQAESSEEAVEILANSHFDAITTDVNLPGENGFWLLKYVRDNIGDIPVLLITGYSSVRSAVDALKLGAQDYLAKPIESSDAFLGSILKAVSHHRLRVQNKALQERLGRAEKVESLANIAGGVAHDLNNIISPMVALPDVIISELEDFSAKSGVDVEMIKEDLALMKASGIRAATVVRDLMTSSRRLNVDHRVLDLNKLISNCVESQEVREIKVGCPSIEIEMSLTEDPCIIMASDAHVSRAVSNLIRNGTEAMDESITGVKSRGSTLKISTRHTSIAQPIMGFDVIEEGDYAVVTVSDLGMGMSKDVLPRIIEPFFSMKKESSRSGSGLGLAVVNGIMKDHSGFLDIKTEEGAGTSFDLYFPFSNESVSRVTAKVAACGGNENILVVDDEPAQRIVAGRMLRKLGYSVDVVNNGHEAIDILAKKSAKSKNGDDPYDLVILDMIMEEDFDGLEVLKEIRKQYADLKAVVASGFAPTGRVQAAISLGAKWLAKPYRLDELATAMREQLDD